MCAHMSDSMDTLSLTTKEACPTIRYIVVSPRTKSLRNTFLQLIINLLFICQSCNIYDLLFLDHNQVIHNIRSVEFRLALKLFESLITIVYNGEWWMVTISIKTHTNKQFFVRFLNIFLRFPQIEIKKHFNGIVVLVCTTLYTNIHQKYEIRQDWVLMIKEKHKLWFIYACLIRRKVPKSIEVTLSWCNYDGNWKQAILMPINKSKNQLINF